MQHYADILIVGSGIAGLTAALHLADHYQIHLLCKTDLGQGSSIYAQGGVAAVMDEDDSTEQHVQDTLIAGDGLCESSAVYFTVEHARACIEWLIDQGIKFTIFDEKSNQPFHLTREGGHSHRRILHASDATGYNVQTTLNQLVKDHPNIHCFEYYHAIDLIVKNQYCLGLYALNGYNERIEAFSARATILATGGASRAYLYSTNPIVSSGDGIAMGYRAGCRVANMEFNQFHPTSLYHPQGDSLLLSEALRGEGAYLKLPDGRRFMHRFDKREELAPRDVVARAIDFVMKQLGIRHVYLDITYRGADFIYKHFPTIHQKLQVLGIDMTRQWIPVVPAAHYTCGGIMVNQKGQTDISGLYAAGEVTYTGLHGANRMASNSLMECLVYARSAAYDIIANFDQFFEPQLIKPWDASYVTDSDEEVFILHNWQEIRLLMWNYMGIVRSGKRLDRAQRRIEMLRQEIFEYYHDFKVTRDLIELRNLELVSDMMIQCAKRREESRGLHFTLDYPYKDPYYQHPTIIKPSM